MPKNNPGKNWNYMSNYSPGSPSSAYKYYRPVSQNPWTVPGANWQTIVVPSGTPGIGSGYGIYNPQYLGGTPSINYMPAGTAPALTLGNGGNYLQGQHVFAPYQSTTSLEQGGTTPATQTETGGPTNEQLETWATKWIAPSGEWNPGSVDWGTYLMKLYGNQGYWGIPTPRAKKGFGSAVSNNPAKMSEMVSGAATDYQNQLANLEQQYNNLLAQNTPEAQRAIQVWAYPRRIARLKELITHYQGLQNVVNTITNYNPTGAAGLGTTGNATSNMGNWRP